MMPQGERIKGVPLGTRLMCQLVTQVRRGGHTGVEPRVALAFGLPGMVPCVKGVPLGTRLMCQLVTQVWREGLLGSTLFSKHCPGRSVI